MSPLGRRREPQGERSAEQREADRLEREARRAAKEGRPPPEPADAAPEAPEDPAPEARDADVGASGGPRALRAELFERPPDAPPSPPSTDPPATAREWGQVAGTPEPDPPLVRRVASGGDAPAPVTEVSEPIPDPAQPEAPPRRIPPAPPLPFDGGGEKPIGTRRVSAVGRIARGRRSPDDASQPPAPPPAPRATAPRGPGRRPLRIAAAILALFLIAVVGWFLVSLFEPFKGKGSGTIVVRVLPGATAGEVGDQLEEQGVVGSGFFFELRARLAGKRNDLKTGTFRLRRDMSYASALDVLTHNPPRPTLIRLTIPEGKSRAEIAPIARQAGVEGDYLKASARSSAISPRKYGAPKGTSTLEGFLFPATYELKPGSQAPKLVDAQIAAFRQNLAGLNLEAARRKHLTTYDVITIASMIEREAGVAKDRALIAAVIYNRLKDGMPLGIDATLRYALRNWTRPLRVSELESDTPYNTRKHAGLPPTPIGNPGLASLRAAARPAKVPLPLLRDQAVRQRRARVQLDRCPVPAGQGGVRPGAGRAGRQQPRQLQVDGRLAPCASAFWAGR